jgi:hypothetical protein
MVVFRSNLFILIGALALVGCVQSGVQKDQKGTIKAEQKLPNMCGFGMLYFGKIKYDKESKTYYINARNGINNTVSSYQLSQAVAQKAVGKDVLLYGSQLVGGSHPEIEGKIIKITTYKNINFNKLKAWCTLQPNSSLEPKAPNYSNFNYKGKK